MANMYISICCWYVEIMMMYFRGVLEDFERNLDVWDSVKIVKIMESKWKMCWGIDGLDEWFQPKNNAFLYVK